MINIYPPYFCFMMPDVEQGLQTVSRLVLHIVLKTSVNLKTTKSIAYRILQMACNVQKGEFVLYLCGSRSAVRNVVK